MSGHGDFGHSAEHGHDHSGFGDNDTGRLRRDRRAKAGVDSQEKAVAVHVESHGALDVKRLFIRLAREAGLVPIDQYRPNLVAEDTVKQQIVDADAWSPPDNEPTMPSGHYPGATGWTRLWREFWQIGVRRNRWKFWEPLEPRFSQRTWIEISCVTWCYNEAGDFQTDLTFQIQVLPVWDPAQRIWMYDSEQFDRHKAAAEKLAGKLCELITARAPFPHAKRVRESARAQVVTPPPTGVPTSHPPIPQTPPPGPPAPTRRAAGDEQGAIRKPEETAAPVSEGDDSADVDVTPPASQPDAASASTDNGGTASGADLSALLGR